jgi:hypothetical protein
MNDIGRISALGIPKKFQHRTPRSLYSGSTVQRVHCQPLQKRRFSNKMSFSARRPAKGPFFYYGIVIVPRRILPC